MVRRKRLNRIRKKGKIKLISLLKQLLLINKYKINQLNNKILITAEDTLYPEDYVEVNYQKELIVVSEIHRANSRTIINTPVKENLLHLMMRKIHFVGEESHIPLPTRLVDIEMHKMRKGVDGCKREDSFNE